MVVCAPTGSGKTVIFEMAIVQLLMELEDKNYIDDFKIIYMAPVKALCTERLTEWYPKFTKFGHLCIEVTGDTDVDFSQLKPYRIIITTPEKWDMLTRRWRDHRGLVEVIKLFLIDEVHILNDETRGPVLEAVVSRMKTIEASSQSAHRIEQLQKQYQENNQLISMTPPRIRFVAVSATVSNPEDVAAWLESGDKAAVFYKFGDECRPVKLKRVVEGYPCPEGMSIFKFDIILNYKLWPIIQKYHDGKPTLIFCNTRKSVLMTAETLSKEVTINFTPEQKSRLTAVASTIKNKKLQSLVLSGVGCHHAGLLFEERLNIENAFRNRDLPILITTTTLAMGVNLPAHLVVIKNTQQYVNGAYQEYSISTVLQMVGRAGRPQFDTEATAVIMTRLCDKPRYQALVSGSEPLQSYLHKRLAENLNSEAALGTVCDVAQCVQWLRSTFLCIRAARDPRRYLGIQPDAPPHLINKKIEELCVKAMNGLASSGLITMDEASCIYATEVGRLMSIYYLDLETMKHIMKIEGSESLEQLLRVICESHELADMHLRVDERRCLNTLNRNNASATIRFPIKGKISTRQMKLNCIIQAVLGCLTIPDPSLNQEAMKVMRIADRICKCLVAYVTRPDHISTQPKCFSAALNALILAKSIAAHLWENSPYVSKQLKGIGPAFSTLLASAGKINFTLLEESHPRDLERIMNKSAPAGNVLRKQISLLPKYQLVMTPISNNKASIQLTLLNHPHLAENIGQLTAGATHKCHIIVGDSENNILLLICFKDKDLIGIYNGTLTYEITRIHNFEHKVFAHCISSNFVGLDVQSEYLFKGLEPLLSQGESMVYPIQEPTIKKMFKKQTTITDSFKERKRKINDLEISQSKEKKKRDNAVIEKFRHLKGSLGKSSTELRKKLQKPVEISNKLRQMTPPGNTKEINHENSFGLAYENENDYDTIVREYEYPEMISEDFDNEQDFTADDHFDNILNEIENEISKTRYSDGPVNSQNHTMSLEQTSRKNKPNPFSKPNCKLLNLKTPTKSTRCNYNFIELLQRRENLSNEDDTISSKSNSGFSDTIKSQVEKFIMNTSITTAYTVDPVMKELISNSSPSKSSNKQVKDLESCPENLMLHNNKIMDKNTTIVLKPPENFIVSPKHLASVKEHDVDMTKGPEVTFGTSRSNNDIDQIPIKGAQNKNQNDFTHENNKVNVISLVNQKNKIKDLQENLSPEMILDDVNNKREFSYFSQELLKSSCDLKKFDHRLHEIAPEKCRQNNNLKITILEQERKGNLLEVEEVEIVKDDTDTYVLGPDSHEKYIPKENLPSLSDVNLKQVECANNNLTNMKMDCGLNFLTNIP
ncbi:probable ATP-dependent DNA helicase HFM1 [Hyposmocoma kahamanoa]|uniref:probable ATP-dependent DNA helicase HFM1 n=1 Tax=Hyposmocoma kahamanoa TaxID=1477025 RepID=UPI000E6D86FC|nr:probable ATP-dependent DNA helicase HFM1 [Hyposmocoma kahamanoa]